MGVPLLYSFLARKHKKEKLSVNYDKSEEKCDNFYIDFNGLIHKVINELEEYTCDDKVFDRILEYTKFITNMVNPVKRLFIAVDGVAPRAKLNQQRMRRFKSASTSTEDVFFDRNRVTPGTDFMNNLDIFLKKHLVFPTIETIFSGVNERGEGEHKILQWVRDNEELLKNDKNILNGLDCDLIMLTASVDLDFKLLREERKGYSIFDVNLLKMLLIDDMEGRIRNKLDTTRFIRDFIIISFFLGNDFLTSLPMLKIKKNGVGILLGAYSMMHKNRILSPGEYIVNNDKTINARYLNEYIGLVWDSQEYWMKREGVKNINTVVDQYHELNFRTICPEFIKKASDKYIEGIFWVGEYYLKGCSDYTWYYPFYFTPFSCDITVYKEYSFAPTLEFTQEQQLVSVLPTKSLPEKFREKTSDPRIRYMFPDSFKIDDSDPDCPEHAKNAFIPFIDSEILFSVMNV